MNTLAVLSFFRNSAGPQVKRFMDQVAELRNLSARPVRVIAVYGDCIDDTAEDLLRQAEDHNIALQLIECSHGGPSFGSTEHPDRMIALSKIGNAGLGGIRLDDEFVFYVESDLIWSAGVVLQLLKRHERRERPAIIAPLVFAGENFYDVYCYRKNGTRFAPFYPYHSELNHEVNALTPVDSVGSGFVMNGEIARKCRMTEGGVLISFCQCAWDRGYEVLVDPSLRIVHP